MTISTADHPGPRLAGEVRFGVLGPVTVTEGTTALNIGGPKQRTVLALLIAHAGDAVSIDSIIGSVWGDDAASNAKRIAQTYVATLRGEVGDAIVKAGQGWRLDVERHQIDAAAFEDLYTTARDVLESNPQRASVALREALAMWRGHPYADIEAHGALEGEIHRLTELRVAAQAARIDTDLALGRDADLVGEIEAHIAEHPYSERFRAQHMLALYRAGRQQEALRSYQQMRTLLLEELGVDPTPDLQDLERRILDQDESLRVAPTQTIQRRAVLVADPGDPIEIGHLPATEREELLARATSAVQSAMRREGDGLTITAGTTTYVVFDSALAAANVAEAVTRRLDGQAMRMAIDWGDMVLEDGRVSGPPVSRAAVMAAVAHKGQVVLSADAQQAIGTSGRGRGLRFENLGSYDLHGVEGSVLIYQLLVGDMPPVFPELETHRLPPPLPGGGDRSVPGYELREALGPGSVGTLYRAFQPSVGREVLVEVIGRGDSSDADFVRNFEADAQRLSLLDHQNIAQVIDYWRQPDGAFLVYRYPRGGLLVQGAVVDAGRLIEQIGSALAYAHSLGMVHGSVRPDRIALDEAGNASLLCFPMAGVDTEHVDEYERFVAPEGGSSVAADIYSLGVVASDQGLEGRAIERATDPDPAQRQPSVSDFLIELNPLDSEAPADRYTESRNPYKGLAAFHENDAGDFFGRAAATDELCHALEGSHLLAIVGPSGIGKSSVARAGLVPALRSGRLPGSEFWLITDMIPGSHPFFELQRALERVAIDLPVDLTEALAAQQPDALRGVSKVLPDGSDLVVLIDQFEELFTMVSESERRAFLDLLATSIHRQSVRFVLTLRADFLDHPLRYSEFGTLLKASAVMLIAPDQEELGESIVKPAQGVGVEVAPGLVERMVAEVHDQPGALPLLQHTLAELFANRHADLIGIAGFEDLGGVSGSLARRAESIYADLGEGEQSRVKQVFLRLVTIVDESAPTRRRVRVADLDDLDARGPIDAYARSRLLVFDSDPETRTPTVEVAHEALLTHWPRLAGWIDSAREDLAMARRLDEARRDWKANDGDDAYLLTGGRLAQHEAWTSSTSLLLTEQQRGFLDLSVEHDRRLKARSRRRRNGVIVGLAIATTVAVVFALRSAQSATKARAEEIAAASIAQSDTDPQLSLLLALEAHRLSGSVSATSAIHAGIQASRELMFIPPPNGSVGASAKVTPSGEKIAVVGFESSIVQAWDLEADSPIWERRLTDDTTAEFARFAHFWFSDDGQRLYVPLSFAPDEWDEPIPSGPGVGLYTLDASTGEMITFHRIPCLVRAMPAGTQYVDDRELFAVDRAGLLDSDLCDPFSATVGLLDRGMGEITFELPVLGSFGPPTLSLDGRLLSVHGWFENPDREELRIYEVPTGETVFRHLDAGGALSSHGSHVLLGGDPSYLYEVATDELVQSFQTGVAPRIWFSPNEDLVLAPTRAGAIKVFETASGKEVFNLVGHTSQVRDAAMNLDQNILISSGFDGARVWDVSSNIRGDARSIDLGVATPFYEDAVSSGEDLLLLRRGPASPFLDQDPHRLELRIKPRGELLWSEQVFAAEIGPEDKVVMLPMEGVGVQSPGGAISLHVGRPILVSGLWGNTIVDLEGCDFYSYVTDEDGAVIEPGSDCIGDGYPVLDYVSFEFSADGTRLLGSTVLGASTIWDTETGRVVSWREANRTEPNLFGQGVRWAASLSPDGEAEVVPPSQDDWDRVGEPDMSVIDVDSGEQLGSFEIDHWANFSRFTNAGDKLIVAGTDLLVVDTGTWSVHLLERPQGSRITDLALSPDDRYAATTSNDNMVAVWDLETRALAAEIPVLGSIGTALSGVAFIDDETLVVAPQAGGPLLRFTLDTQELVDMAFESLNRPFSSDECATYDIDPCPSLEEMKSG